MSSNSLSSQRTALRRRNMRRYLLWFAIPVIKMISLSGCHPREGEEGGSCHRADGCHTYDYCDDDLVCSDGICRRPWSDSYAAAPSCGYLDSNVSPCLANEYAMKCDQGAQPDPGCVTRQMDQDGTTVACCSHDTPTVDAGTDGADGAN